MRGKKHTPKSKKNSSTPSRRISVSQITVNTSLALVTIMVVAATIFKISEFIIEKQEDIFPKLEFSLLEAPIEQINFSSKDIIYTGNTLKLTVDNQSTVFNNVEIKGRGNTTWNRPKKPYQIKLSEKSSLFNLKAAKKWLLLANYIDPSHLRNDTAFYLEELLDEPYAMHGNFLEVYFDESYNGLYYLTEKVEIKKPRINLSDKYGIIVEFDNVYGGFTGCFYDAFENCLTIKDSVNPDNQDSAMELFIKDFNSLQIAIQNQDYETIQNLIDIDSFARYYLLNEFTVNPDAYSTSFYLYKNGKDDKIHAGPGWDFDIAFGNTSWIPESSLDLSFYTPSETTPLKTFIIDHPNQEILKTIPVSSLLYDLIEFPEFSDRIKELYQQYLSGHGAELIDYIKNQADYIRDAAYRDQARWKLKTDFNAEVDYLIDWVGKRYDHFEATYGINSTPESTDFATEYTEEI